MEIKRPSDSITTMTNIVMPNDTNIVGNLFGGTLMQWMDICGALAAARHSRNVCVTASVNNISFAKPIHLGETVTLISRVVRAFNTSMEVYIEVYAEDVRVGQKRLCNDAYFTYVAMDSDYKTVKVPAIQPLSDDEKGLFELSLLRRQLKLLMAEKIQLRDAPELKKQMEDWLKNSG
ncbi:MAG: acyl-CoA thioesterase [Bacteroidetes bacterium]|jgi:acyl-CoA hydrolase|nr:acyl-CoA thioesterase [Bacteroidota bacterium]